MSSDSSVLKYSPIGWGGWVFGPMFVLAALILLGIWVNEITHRVANSGVPIHSLSDWFVAATCFSSRCVASEYAFGAISWTIFFLAIVALWICGMLVMNGQRSTLIQSGALVTWRGSFFPWARETWRSSDIASIDAVKVPLFAVFARRVYKVGEKWGVEVTLRRRTMMGKPKKWILMLVQTESEAKSIAERCVSSVGR